MKEKILKFITGYIKQHGYPPSRREIGEGVGLRSTSSVQSHIVSMLEAGMLESDDEYGTPRALRVPGMKFVQAGKSNYEKYAGTKEKFADFIMFAYTHNDEWEPASDRKADKGWKAQRRDRDAGHCQNISGTLPGRMCTAP